MADVSRLSQIIACLANPGRLRVLELLATSSGSISVAELCEKTGEDQSTISHRLRVLRDCGLISLHRVGPCHYYDIQETFIECVFQEIKQLLRMKESKMPRPPLQAAGEALVH